MTAVERAEQAVTEAREALLGFALLALPNEPGIVKAEKLADALIRAVEARCAERRCRCYPHPYSHEEECPQRAELLATIHPDTKETP